MTEAERQASEAEGSSPIEEATRFEPAGATHRAAHPVSTASPILMVGAERSGSTLLRLMLDHHPEISFERELDPAVEMISDEGEFPVVADYAAWLGTVRGFDCPIDPSLDFVGLLDSFLQQGRPFAAVKPHTGVSLHHHFDRALRVWPKARFLHLIRDPRDVAPSVVAKGWAGNVYAGAGFWVEAERCWDRLKARLTQDQFIEVRYEDLIREPEKELTRVCEWIGVSFDPRMLEYTVNAPQYPKPDARHAERWKRELSFHKVHWVEVQAAELMTPRGYKPLHPSPKPFRPLRHRLVMAGSRLGALRHRMHEYGPATIVLSGMTRRLGPAWLDRKLHRRMLEIDTEVLRLESLGLGAPSAHMPSAMSAAPLDPVKIEGNAVAAKNAGRSA